MGVDAMRTPDWASDDGAIRLYCDDCLSILPTIPAGAVDAVVTDPPYGMNLDTDFSGFNGWGGKGHAYERIAGDDKPFDPTPFISVGRSHVFWGAQYFCHRLPESGGWLVFNKRGDGRPSEICFGDCELAWCDTQQSVRMFSHMWHGVARWSSEGRHHPSQKPVSLMAWCCEQAKTERGDTILDPFLGSGTTAIACIRTGRRFIGCEIEPRYFDIAVRRIKAELSQPRLFTAPEPRHVQAAMFDGKESA